MTIFADRFNKATHHIDTDGFKYQNLSDIYNDKKPDTVFNCSWLFIKAGKFGDQPVFIDEPNKMLVNIPTHMTAVCSSILSDLDGVQSVKDGKVGFSIYKYESHARVCYGINFVDLV